MLSCPSCKGRFLKTLENRVLYALQSGAVLSKKRCKRCKTAFLAKLMLHHNKSLWRYATPQEWRRAKKIKNPPSRVFQGPYPMVGRYSLIISQNTANVYETVLRYNMPKQSAHTVVLDEG